MRWPALKYSPELVTFDAIVIKISFWTTKAYKLKIEKKFRTEYHWEFQA